MSEFIVSEQADGSGLKVMQGPRTRVVAAGGELRDAFFENVLYGSSREIFIFHQRTGSKSVESYKETPACRK
jgi:hypothetical protein